MVRNGFNEQEVWSYSPRKLWLYVDLVWREICAERAFTTIDTSAAIGGALGGKLQEYIDLIGEEE